MQKLLVSPVLRCNLPVVDEDAKVVFRTDNRKTPRDPPAQTRIRHPGQVLRKLRENDPGSYRMIIEPIREFLGGVRLFRIALDSFANHLAIHSKHRPLPIADGMNLENTGDRKDRELTDALAAHGRTPLIRQRPELRASLETDIQEPVDHRVTVHSRAVIGDSDRAGVLVQVDSYLGRVRIPCVRDDLRQHRRHVAVEVHPQMLQRIQTDGHLQLAPVSHACPPHRRCSDAREPSGRLRMQGERARHSRSFGRLA